MGSILWLCESACPESPSLTLYTLTFPRSNRSWWWGSRAANSSLSENPSAPSIGGSSLTASDTAVLSSLGGVKGSAEGFKKAILLIRGTRAV